MELESNMTQKIAFGELRRDTSLEAEELPLLSKIREEFLMQDGRSFKSRGQGKGSPQLDAGRPHFPRPEGVGRAGGQAGPAA